ncbi:mitochondrial S-adenosylmethionine carrier protein-like isoform X3 [Corticium candelabrum]|nr:mitochondrial S-adenosylmethionine carrier protein-like isoform X3 [Corticium candelabrum]
METVPFGTSVLAGGVAGMAVDIVLFPIDTIKTRLQSHSGFWRSGGFRGMYAGLASVVVGSAPGAALFFCTYELLKTVCIPHITQQQAPFLYMVAACCGEIVACGVRVPVEVVKQRTQANLYSSSFQCLIHTIKSEGIRGLFRGYATTVVREIPFALVQYPCWEFFKRKWSSYQSHLVSPVQGALCGAVAGGLSAAVTTPLDVAKTRVMLAEKASADAKARVLPLLVKIGQMEGISG